MSSLFSRFRPSGNGCAPRAAPGIYSPAIYLPSPSAHPRRPYPNRSGCLGDVEIRGASVYNRARKPADEILRGQGVARPSKASLRQGRSETWTATPHVTEKAKPCLPSESPAVLKVLAIDEEVPWPPNSGKRLRTYNLFKRLAGRHDITWVCRRLEGVDFDARGFLDLGIRVEVVSHPVSRKAGFRFHAALLANLFSPYPYVVASHRSNRMSRRIDEILRSQPFDLIHCEWTPYAVNLGPASEGIPKVLSAHNVESAIWEKTFRTERSPARKAFFFLQWRKMQRFERVQCPRFERVVAVSEIDKEILSRWIPRGRIDVVANGVDTEYFRPGCFEEEPASIVFVGSLDWRPNVDAVEYFLDSIWPLIRRAVPECVFSVVGRNAGPQLRRRIAGEKSVRLFADVPDVRPYLGRASVCVVPLRIGGGTRLKILEALAMGKCVVSTSAGAEGLNVASGEHLVIADDPVRFSAAVVRLINDGDLRRSFGHRGRLLVESGYGWSMLAQGLEKSWTEAAGTRSGFYGAPARFAHTRN